MSRTWYITTADHEYGCVIADTPSEADIILFRGLLAGEYPADAFLVEEIEEEEELTDEDILSSE